MRGLTAGAAAALAREKVPMALLIDMDLTVPLRLCTGGWTLTWDAKTYTAVGTLGAVNDTREADGQPSPVQFTLSGVPSSMVSLALTEPVQGKSVVIRCAILNPDTYAVEDAPIEWEGTLDTMTIDEKGDTATIAVSAEHAGLDLLRAQPLRYTDVDQQRLYPGDSAFEFVTDQAEKQIVWPAASFFRK